MANKVFGYIVVLLGLTIIFATIFGSYQIFTGKMAIPSLFPTPEKNASNGSANGDLQKQIEQTIQKQISGLIPVDFLPRIFNLVSWSILAGILIFGGAQIAGIGIRLIAIKPNPQI